MSESFHPCLLLNAAQRPCNTGSPSSLEQVSTVRCGNEVGEDKRKRLLLTGVIILCLNDPKSGKKQFTYALQGVQTLHGLHRQMDCFPKKVNKGDTAPATQL